ncbi:MAG TPA: DUF4384 domain-containing protein [Paludibaculum sp.]
MKFGLTLLMTTALLAQSQQPPPRRMEIQVELRKGTQWKQVDASTVFEKGAQIRFRVKASFAGYLYVMNQGTGGTYTLLFPREDTGQENRIEAGREYTVPATEGSFRVAGPPGHDVVYWMVTPVELGQSARPQSAYVPLPPPPPPGTKLNTLTPRCDDAVFKARGECLDSKAGPRKVSSLDDLPPNLKDVPNLRSRELVFIKEKDGAVVSTAANLKGPLVYEFRLSHK